MFCIFYLCSRLWSLVEWLDWQKITPIPYISLSSICSHFILHFYTTSLLRKHQLRSGHFSLCFAFFTYVPACGVLWSGWTGKKSLQSHTSHYPPSVATLFYISTPLLSSENINLGQVIFLYVLHFLPMFPLVES